MKLQKKSAKTHTSTSTDIKIKCTNRLFIFWGKIFLPRIRNEVTWSDYIKGLNASASHPFPQERLCIDGWRSWSPGWKVKKQSCIQGNKPGDWGSTISITSHITSRIRLNYSITKFLYLKYEPSATKKINYKVFGKRKLLWQWTNILITF